MFTLMELVQPSSLEEAYEILMKRKNNIVIGGSAFLRMGEKRIGTGIDLSNLNLNLIEETEDYKLIKVKLLSDGDMSQECIEYVDNEGKNLGTVSYTIYGNGEYHIYTIEVRDDQKRTWRNGSSTKKSIR